MTKTVLITEDERMLREMMVEDLEEQGVKVVQAENGAEAIKIMEDQKPDLLLLDILMPKVDGYGVLRHNQWYEPQSKLWTPFSGASSGESDHRLRKQVYFLQAARPA